MPIPITHLFTDEEDVNIHRQPNPEDIRKMSTGWPNINIDIHDIPNYPYPEPESSAHRNDLECLTHYVDNPVSAERFLKMSDEKPFQLFKKYVDKYNLNVDMEELDNINNDLANFVLTLKFKYNRPRPKKYMKNHNYDFNYESIQDNKSPSYPSGHAAHAFFNACFISEKHPDHELHLKNLAELIAQSRIDLGVHYPSDVSFGKFIGEYASQALNNENKKEKVTNMINENSSNQEGRKKIIFYKNRHNERSLGTSYAEELCEFIIRSNDIENYKVNIRDAYQASKNFLKGLPVSYCTNDKYIFSHLNALDAALEIGAVNTPSKVQKVHKALGDNVLERGYGGVFRDYVHSARTGYPFSDPENVLTDLLEWCKKDHNTLFERHVEYECIHPFSDGNGRSGRIILAADLDFDLAKLNDLIGNDYIPNIIKHQNAKII